MLLHQRPIGLSQNQHPNLPFNDSLLVSHVCVTGYEQVESAVFGKPQQLSVLPFLPPPVPGRRDFMVEQLLAERPRNSVVEQNLHQ